MSLCVNGIHPGRKRVLEQGAFGLCGGRLPGATLAQAEFSPGMFSLSRDLSGVLGLTNDRTQKHACVEE